MNSIIRKTFLVSWKPNVLPLRYRNKINIQRPALPHYQRAKVLKICEPMYHKPRISRIPSVELCLKPVEGMKKQDEEVNLYANVLAKELHSLTVNSGFVGFFHTNPITASEKFKVMVALKKLGGCLRVYGKTTAEKAWHGTHYEPAMCLLTSHTSLVFCPDGSPQNIAAIFKIFRNVSVLLLMAAIVDKKLLDYSELVRYSKLSDLTTERVKLISVLNAAGGNVLLKDLNFLQNTLVNQLQQHTHQLKRSNGSGQDGSTPCEIR